MKEVEDMTFLIPRYYLWKFNDSWQWFLEFWIACIFGRKQTPICNFYLFINQYLYCISFIELYCISFMCNIYSESFDTTCKTFIMCFVSRIRHHCIRISGFININQKRSDSLDALYWIKRVSTYQVEAVYSK